MAKAQPHEAHHGEAPFRGPIEAAVAPGGVHGIFGGQVQGSRERKPGDQHGPTLETPTKHQSFQEDLKRTKENY